jgi:hypothetical protein
MRLKDKIHKLRFKWLCRSWKKCVNLTFNQEWALCNNKKCPLANYQGLTRAYKKTFGTYRKEEDTGI